MSFTNPSTASDKLESLKFIIARELNNVNTVTLGKVLKCTNNGALSLVGYVDIQPMVNQMDSKDQGLAQPILYNVPYLRIQGGANAVIIDPKAGDIGICLFTSRDISSIKNTRKQGNPASLRTFSLSDGLYLGGILNAQPDQYVRFSDSGIELVSPTKVTITAPSAVINGPTTINGNTIINGTFSQSGGGASTMSGTLATTGNITAGGISLQTHKHTGVTTGGGQTGNPV
jgi:Phage protein Gp138 N-terminal domain/GpV Apex motif